MRIVGPETEFGDGFDAAARHDAEEFKRLDAEIAALRASLRRTADKLGDFVREHNDPGADAYACLHEARELLSR